MAFPTTGNIVFQPELDNVQQALNCNGCISGFATTQRGAGANMSVDVATGIAFVNGTYVKVSGTTNVVISAADVTNPRIDLITLDSSGVLAAVTGTAATPASPPNLPANKILIAYVAVAANTGSILTANCTDKRLNVQPNRILGEIRAWQKSATGVPQDLPYGFMLCDGSTISDAASPMNGQAAPTLNANQVLLGSGTSGSTGQWTSTGAGINYLSTVFLYCFK